MNDHDEILLRYEQSRDSLAQAWIELENNRFTQAQARLRATWEAVQEIKDAGILESDEVKQPRANLAKDVQNAWAWVLQWIVWPSATRSIPASPPDALSQAFTPLEDWRALESLANTLLNEPRAAKCIEMAIVAFRALLDTDRQVFVATLAPLKPHVCQRYLIGFDSMTELVRRGQYAHANTLQPMVDEQHTRVSAPEAWERLAEAVNAALQQHYTSVYAAAVRAENPIETFETRLQTMDSDLRALAQVFWREDRQDVPSLELARQVLWMLEDDSHEQEFSARLARVPIDELGNFHAELERALVERYQERVAVASSYNPLRRLPALFNRARLTALIEAGWQADELVRSPIWRRELNDAMRQMRRVWLETIIALLILLVGSLLVLWLFLGNQPWIGWLVGGLVGVVALAIVVFAARVAWQLYPRMSAARRSHLFSFSRAHPTDSNVQNETTAEPRAEN